MAVSENVDMTQQVTSKTPVTKIKNPKRVAAGIAAAEKTKQAREAQKQALIDAHAIIANQKKSGPDLPVANPSLTADPPPTADPATADPQTLTTTQWLSVNGIIISVVGVYYKREEIKKVFAQPKAQTPPPVDFRTPPVKTPRKGVSSRWIKFSLN